MHEGLAMSTSGCTHDWRHLNTVSHKNGIGRDDRSEYHTCKICGTARIKDVLRKWIKNRWKQKTKFTYYEPLLANLDNWPVEMIFPKMGEWAEMYAKEMGLKPGGLVRGPRMMRIR